MGAYTRDRGNELATVVAAAKAAWDKEDEAEHAAALAIILKNGGQRFGARTMLAAATTYERHYPLAPTLDGLRGMDAPTLDQIGRPGAAL